MGLVSYRQPAQQPDPTLMLFYTRSRPGASGVQGEIVVERWEDLLTYRYPETKMSKMLIPHYPLTYGELAEYAFDPNATVLYTLESRVRWKSSTMRQLPLCPTVSCGAEWLFPVIQIKPQGNCMKAPFHPQVGQHDPKTS
jgi:hypothetical protein